MGISRITSIRGGISGLLVGVPAWVVSISSVEHLGIGFGIGFGFSFSVTFDESVDVVEEGGSISGGVSMGISRITSIRGGISGLLVGVPRWVVSISSVVCFGISLGLGFSFSLTFEYSWVSHI